ncbi:MULTISPECIES: MMPL family transporter [unclassified Streptomyces]|uniref:MMPL family transporter n=1 Tax=unclassified Streptomyces TaxID=2593676 RepID=UPI00336A6C2D
MDANFPVLIVAIAFGLAMDYQVFLLSRVRERYLATGDPAESTATALQRTAGTITSAGLLLAVLGLLGHRAWRGQAPSHEEHRAVPALEPQGR